jgi:serine/threonine protein kinase
MEETQSEKYDRFKYYGPCYLKNTEKEVSVYYDFLKKKLVVLKMWKIQSGQCKIRGDLKREYHALRKLEEKKEDKSRERTKKQQQQFQSLDQNSKIIKAEEIFKFQASDSSWWYCLVLEYIPDGDLFDLIERLCQNDQQEQNNFLESFDIYFTLNLKRWIMIQLLQGLKEIHSFDVYPIDISPENILIKYPTADFPGDLKKEPEEVLKEIKKVEIKFCDFAEASLEKCYNVYPGDHPRQKKFYRAPEIESCEWILSHSSVITSKLTLSRSAPELESSKKKKKKKSSRFKIERIGNRNKQRNHQKLLFLKIDAEKADIWALGVTFYALMTGNQLYETPNYLNSRYPIDPCMQRISQSRSNYQLCQTLSEALQRVPKLELYLPEKEKSGFISLLSNMLNIIPEKRCSAKSLLQHPWLSFS